MAGPSQAPQPEQQTAPARSNKGKERATTRMFSLMPLAGMSKRFKRLRDNAIMAGKITGFATPFIKRKRVPPGPQPWPKDLPKPATFVDFRAGKAPGHAFLLPASELPCVRAYEGKCKGNNCRYRHLQLGNEQDPEAYLRAFMHNITIMYGTVAHPTPIGLSWVAQVHGTPQHGGGPSHNPASAPISEREEGELPDTDITPAPSSEREEGEMSEDESSSVRDFMGPGSNNKPDRGPPGLGLGRSRSQYPYTGPSRSRPRTDSGSSSNQAEPPTSMQRVADTDQNGESSNSSGPDQSGAPAADASGSPDRTYTIFRGTLNIVGEQYTCTCYTGYSDQSQGREGWVFAKFAAF